MVNMLRVMGIGEFLVAFVEGRSIGCVWKIYCYDDSL